MFFRFLQTVSLVFLSAAAYSSVNAQNSSRVQIRIDLSDKRIRYQYQQHPWNLSLNFSVEMEVNTGKILNGKRCLNGTTSYLQPSGMNTSIIQTEKLNAECEELNSNELANIKINKRKKVESIKLTPEAREVLIGGLDKLASIIIPFGPLNTKVNPDLFHVNKNIQELAAHDSKFLSEFYFKKGKMVAKRSQVNAINADLLSINASAFQ
ncbi:MAG: hypothetical protein QE271_02420 [Bacteriovoracaceae bacterium]|nr:hypothetical protein [Bacteriovoracaceae bacterium]